MMAECQCNAMRCVMNAFLSHREQFQKIAGATSATIFINLNFSKNDKLDFIDLRFVSLFK